MTWVGSINVASTIRKTVWRPRHRSLDSAYATGTDDSTTPTVESTAYSVEFRAYRHSGKMWKTSLKFAHRNGLGHTLVDRACCLVMSAVSTMNRNGARNTTDIAMAIECEATDARKRRRRTSGGSPRGTTTLRAAVGRITVAVAIGSLPDSGPSAWRCGSG